MDKGDFLRRGGGELLPWPICFATRKLSEDDLVPNARSYRSPTDAKAEETDRVRGLERGADDYVVILAELGTTPSEKLSITRRTGRLPWRVWTEKS